MRNSGVTNLTLKQRYRDHEKKKKSDTVESVISVISISPVIKRVVISTEYALRMLGIVELSQISKCWMDDK